jgi:glycogen debranching enzyme
MIRSVTWLSTHFKLIPHTPYYGTADATLLYLITLNAAWRATGDRGLLEQHLQTAEGCLAWIDKYGDRDGDGFQARLNVPLRAPQWFTFLIRRFRFWHQ